MRTTITLDPDVEAKLKNFMKERGISFKEAVNYAVRQGIGGRGKNRKPFRQKTFSMGVSVVPLRKAMQLAADMEDDEVVRDLSVRK